MSMRSLAILLIGLMASEMAVNVVARPEIPIVHAAKIVDGATHAAPFGSPLAIPRGGDVFSLNLRRIQRFAHRTTTALLPANLANLYEQEAIAAQKRRDYYHLNANLATTFAADIFHPIRVVTLSTLAFVVVHLLELCSGQETLTSFWDGTVVPVLMAKTENIQKWWDKGRKKGGLFEASTWEHRSDRPKVLLKAWNRQFSHKYQRVIGTASGLIVSPAVWTCTGMVGSYLAITVVVMQLNYFLGEQVELLLRPISKTLSNIWGDVDVLLERGRLWLGKVLARPLAMLKAVDDDSTPAEYIPAAIQQGFVMGVVLGFAVGA